MFKIKKNKIIKYKNWDKKVVIIPEDITELGYESFREHNEIDEIILPESIQSISFKAFYKFKGIVHKLKEYDLNLDFQNKKIGDTLLFGRYPQDDVGNVKPIEWIVLDEKEDSLFLISSICLDCQQYYEDWDIVSWKNSSIRKWLNDLFYQYAFNNKEKEKILETKIETLQSISIKDNHSTIDKIFLLNKKECLYYFPNPKDRISSTTNHVKIKGMDDYHKPFWWLRNPGDSAEYIGVGPTGIIYEFGIYMTYYHGIRPCLWIRK